jgi:hypothetical protein
MNLRLLPAGAAAGSGIALSDRRRSDGSSRLEPMAKSAMKRQPAKTPAAIDLDAGRPANLGTERIGDFRPCPKSDEGYVLYRSGELVTGEEFANVAGRAGRAFVDGTQVVEL